MSSRPHTTAVGTKTSTGHRRSESSGHQRHSSSGSANHKSDSGQSIDSECHRERKHGHYRSKSGAHDRERIDSGSSQYSLQPEREPIKFDVNLVGAPPEVEQLVNNIKQVAEQFLYHWKTFPIVLPSPVSQSDSFPTSHVASDGSLSRTKSKFHLRDLFVAPSFDELDAVAVDSKGEPRKLTGKQLEYIRERGTFEVDSLNFPGQQHVWQLSQLLQKGTERSRESLLNDLALALRFVVVTGKGRLVSHFFSVSEAIKGLINGLLRILDILIGIPSLQAHNLDTKIREERSKYLVAELVCRPENEDSLELLCSYVRKQLRRAAMEKFEVAKECSQPPVSVPYRFLTPAAAELDLRLWDRGLMRKALPILVAILERRLEDGFYIFGNA
ncbi:hypothetical protein MML48_8g00017365 [Holotrichia oblita]|uniref:Uncharacterized protein n=1 Tax=Holotrichia oblita TaxID=644536 RepID=A0ACB9SNZ6_HOLOL|nr:hypothetical protein MML48_8g00017365 [Holotrichia oblita]